MVEESYQCEQCDPPTDITAQVKAERDDNMVVLRQRGERGGSPQPWSVVVICSNGHQEVVSGEH